VGRLRPVGVVVGGGKREGWVRYSRNRAAVPRGIDPAAAAVAGGNGGSEIVRVLDAVAAGFRGLAVPDLKCSCASMGRVGHR
jgi:hypothetical protein